MKVEFSWGATEAKAVDGLVDAIVEVTETGTTLRANGLKIVHTLLETNTKLIANKAAMKDPAKKRKIQHIALLLRGALAAENMVGMKMNVPEASFDEVVGLLPSLTSPTVARLHDYGVVLRGDHRPRIRGAGAGAAAHRKGRRRDHRVPAQQGRQPRRLAVR